MQEDFIENLPPAADMWIEGLSTVDNYNRIYETPLSTATGITSKPDFSLYDSPLNAHQRWNNLLLENDDRKLWRGINWKGEWDRCDPETPPDSEFAAYFGDLFNKKYRHMHFEINIEALEFKYMPVLDDIIQPFEVYQTLKQLKAK